MVHNDDSSVGYGKPPKATRFRKGTSGNPAGRPRGAKNFRTDLAEELNEITAVGDGGTVSKQRAILKKLIALAIGGNVRAASTVLALCERHFGDEDVAGEDAAVDQQILDQHIEREVARRLRARSKRS